MPRTVRIALWLYGSIVLLSTAATLVPLARAPWTGPSAVILGTVLPLAGLAFFLLYKVSQGRAWARTVLGALALGSLGSTLIPLLLPHLHILLPASVANHRPLMQLVSAGVQLSILVLLFTGGANTWFRRSGISPRRLIARLNAFFSLLTAGIVVGATLALPVAVILYLQGASRLTIVAIALGAYGVVYVLSLVKCEHARATNDFTARTLGWALAPAIGILGILLAGLYLFGICNLNPPGCEAPVLWQVAHPNQTTVRDLEERQPPTAQQIQEATAVETDRQRTVVLNKCANDEFTAWRARQSPPPTTQQQAVEVTAITRTCLLRVLGPNHITEAHVSGVNISPEGVVTFMTSPSGKSPALGGRTIPTGYSQSDILIRKTLELHECVYRKQSAWFAARKQSTVAEQRAETEELSHDCESEVDHLEKRQTSIHECTQRKLSEWLASRNQWTVAEQRTEDTEISRICESEADQSTAGLGTTNVRPIAENASAAPPNVIKRSAVPITAPAVPSAEPPLETGRPRVYHCTGADGTSTFSDIPCASSAGGGR